ncbi:N,N-dimethylformamidase beta subunit family domain-containing protein [Verrucomicrobiota bacterium sgz303538]
MDHSRKEKIIAFSSLFHWAAPSLTCCGVLLVIMSVQVANPIVIENALPGNPKTEWDVFGSGDASIQGFATDISVNKGETVRFKVDTDAKAYRIDIYRLGYYGGLGARKVATVTPSVPLPQIQPPPLSDPATGLVDCGNWAESASWEVPATATSGVYIGKLVRPDTGGISHMVFVVRDDAGGSDILVQTSDTTWQAYNRYGGNSLYEGSPAGRAYKVSYNRPFITRGGHDTSYDWLFSGEYPMIRWLEANGYNVSYTTAVDTARRGALMKTHKVFLAMGHNEYCSGDQRANIESARAAGINLAFFTGNDLFWKIRWEPAIDGSRTPYRTLVCYKETHAGAKIDPTPTWTGTWRDPRFSPPSDGGRPENALIGTLFCANGIRTDSLTVPAAYGAHRFWRHTSVAALKSGEVATFPAGTLGYEWDEVSHNGFQPPGLMRLSSTTVSHVPLLQDYGSTYAPGRATHSLVLYRHASGALVFGAGTVQWSWGLDSVHDNGSAPADPRMQQATVNLLADMGTFPETLQNGLIPATTSSDTTAPVSSIQTPSLNTTLTTGSSVKIAGTAQDSGGRVWGVEVSVDGGNIWQPAMGQENWSFAWTPKTPGPITIRSRAVDDSGNLESSSCAVEVTVTK